jgi:hypothetical protein
LNPNAKQGEAIEKHMQQASRPKAGRVLSGLPGCREVSEESNVRQGKRETRREAAKDEGGGMRSRPVREVTFVARKGCRYCGSSELRARGLCASHYQQAWRYVEIERRTTWEKLEATGRVAAKRHEFKEWLGVPSA